MPRKTVPSTQRLPAPPPGEQAEAEQPESDEHPVQRPPSPAHASRRAGRATRSGRSWWRRSRRIRRLVRRCRPRAVPCPSSRGLGRFPVPGSGRRRARARICSSRSSARRRAEKSRMAGDDLGADLFRVPVRGQIGAGEEDLPAAGRDRHEAVEGDVLRIVQGATTTGDPGEQDRRLGQRRAAVVLEPLARTRRPRAARRRPGTPAGPVPMLRAKRREAAIRAPGGPGSHPPPRRSPARSRPEGSPPAARSSASPGTPASAG